MAAPVITKGAWDGSTIDVGYIEHLRDRNKLPAEEFVETRLPGSENAPTPRDGVIVVFGEHFVRRLGLPASNFFRAFLEWFGLQPHHLVPNAILQLAAFVTLCKGYLGVEPRIDFFLRLFFLKKQTVIVDVVTKRRVMMACGAALIHVQAGGGFPKLPLLESVKSWQKGFFYVKNVKPDGDDYINLPAFNDQPPADEHNWKLAPRGPAEIPASMVSRLASLVGTQGLTAVDLLAAFTTL